MDQLLTNIVPLYLFMLIPVWIPLIAVVVGASLDRFRPAQASPATVAVTNAKARSIEIRADRSAAATSRPTALAA